ncbi:redoxin domain-containing protein [Haloferula sp.]|uniref:redoxin domain-containing protein n=1 Tax=Haloferula sp. TaxID=2497595 RepID=UPI003C75DD24
MRKHPLLFAAGLLFASCANHDTPVPSSMVYDPGKLEPIDSRLAVSVGQLAPDFTLPSLSGSPVRLSSYRGKKNVVISFVPAAFTPVCSAQWPGYSLAYDLLEQEDTVMLGITTDNVPTLHAWTSQMGELRFEALSDFWPHGKVASEYGVLRSDGTTERALFLIDKKGIIRWIDVHDINKRPPLEDLVERLSLLEE